MKKHIKIVLSLLLIATAIGAAPKAKKPKNFAELFGKTWTLEKAFAGKQDLTERYVKETLQGNALVYTFSEDGSMTCNDPGAVSCDWIFDDKGFQIHTRNKIPENPPPGQAYAENVTLIWSLKIIKDTLTLEQPVLKMKMIFKGQ